MWLCRQRSCWRSRRPSRRRRHHSASTTPSPWAGGAVLLPTCPGSGHRRLGVGRGIAPSRSAIPSAAARRRDAPAVASTGAGRTPWSSWALYAGPWPPMARTIFLRIPTVWRSRLGLRGGRPPSSACWRAKVLVVLSMLGPLRRAQKHVAGLVRSGQRRIPSGRRSETNARSAGLSGTLGSSCTAAVLHRASSSSSRASLSKPSALELWQRLQRQAPSLRRAPRV
mmetsp:Transcript_67032/g.143400  ORF Transcript_67032/g.143400 Transcript_67032/m.143400 type:complete len:225 (-) Transcript_67032:415-1089(-)